MRLGARARKAPPVGGGTVVVVVWATVVDVVVGAAVVDVVVEGPLPSAGWGSHQSWKAKHR
jgi:hypothetical protein